MNILIAVVKGDKHVNGKNKVKDALIHSGFTVDDLGVDCSSEDIINRIIETGSKYLILSAGMTKSNKQMEIIIDDIRLEGLDVSIFVGGQFVTQSIAISIGADLFLPSAEFTVDYFNQLQNR